MPTWNADQYLKFAVERTQPCRDLVARIGAANVRSIIDLGCGPGNSTAVLAERWPEADITGLDSSASMIDVARREQPGRRWIARDISEWAADETGRFDIVFSNAALHWVPDHASLYPRLLARVRAGGVIAVQIPADFDALPHRLMRELGPMEMQVKEWHAHEPAFYYDLLAPHTERVDVWKVEYQHVMPDSDAIVEWYRGTGMRPFLEAFQTDADREKFIAEYSRRIRTAYPSRPDGKVLFPFLRLFVIATRRLRMGQE
jgi:trans-aconitate 2-methyltransferase